MVTSTPGQHGNNGTPAPLDPGAVKQQAGDAAQNLKDQAQQTVGNAADQVKQSAFTQVGSQKDRVSGSLSGFADTLHQAGQQLESSDQSGFFAKYVHQAAGTVDQLASHLDERDLNELIAEVETYARQQPAIFLGGAFVLGVLGARFLKSSGQRQQETGAPSGSTAPSPSAKSANMYRPPVMSGTRDTATGVSRPSTPSAVPVPSTPSPAMGSSETPARSALRVASPATATGTVAPRGEDADRLDALRRGDVPHQMDTHGTTSANTLTGQSVRTATGDTARNSETT